VATADINSSADFVEAVPNCSPSWSSPTRPGRLGRPCSRLNGVP